MTADPATPRRRLRHRVPLSLRKHWRLLALSVAALVVVVIFLGDTRIRPYITADTDVITSPITQNVVGTVELFDPSVAHEIRLDIDEVEYARMIDAFERNGDKDWVTADLTIDGEFINDVAVRLKGNSTLMGLRGEDAAPGGGPGGRFGAGGPPAMPEGMEPPAGMPEMPEGMAPLEGMPQMPEGMEMPAAGEMPQMPGGMAPPGMDAGISADDPSSLPLLISFDHTYEGRAYQGMTELSVRPGTPVLNEAVALEMTAATGQVSQRYAYSEFSVNDGPTTTRLVLEHPDDGYVSSAFDGPGYLYKADANSRFEYVGQDQSDYADQFTAINSKDQGTLQPVIDLLEWMDSASDEEFAAELDEWVDVESFAEYLATQNLLSNFDDMAGPGQNYYLWYSLDDRKFTVVSWDLNLAMSGDTGTGPQDTVSMAPPGEATGMPGEATAPAGGAPAPPGGAAEIPADGPRGPAMGHPLKTRFLESTAFTDLYEQAYWELYDQIYGSGLAAQTLDALRGIFPLTDGVDQATLDEEATTLRTWIDERTAALAQKRPA